MSPGEVYPRDDPPFVSLHWRDGRTLPEFCLALNIAGEGEYQTRKHHGRIHPGEAFFYQPGEWHRHRPLVATGWTILWIHFNGSAAIQWMREGAFQARANKICVENHELFRAQFEYLLESVQRRALSNSPHFSRQAIGLLSHFVSDSFSRKSGHDVSKDEVVRAIVEHIWNFSHGIVDVPSVVAKMGIPRRTLDRRFRSVTGHSVLNEIQLCRISRAAKLLKETDIPIKHIVYRAGFRSEEHLRIAFHKHYGQSPRSYRKMG